MSKVLFALPRRALRIGYGRAFRIGYGRALRIGYGRAFRIGYGRALAPVAVLATALALLVPVTLATSSPAQADALPATGGGLPATVTADALPTMQVNGVVFGSAIVGDTVYVTGSFTYARPSGQALSPTHAGETAVGSIAAYSISNGKMVATFIHTLDGTGRTISVSPDGKRIYVGGGFTHVDGKTHNHIVAFVTATGAVDTTFMASVGSTVTAIAPTSATVYVGGSFTSAGGQNRSNLAAFTVNGALLSWAPVTYAGFVESMVLAPDQSRLIVGGHFSYLRQDSLPTSGWVLAPGSGSLNAVTGAVLPWAVNTRLYSYGANGYMGGLSTDGKLIYGAGVAASFDPSNFEGRFAADPLTGAIVWADSCYGDTYDTLPVGTVLYTVTQHDIDSGAVTNTAAGHGIDPLNSDDIVSNESTAQWPTEGAIGLTKTAITTDTNGNSITDAGDVINWIITVKNTGGSVVDDIVVTDPTAGAVTCPTSTLNSGESMVCTVAPHIIASEDEGKTISNTVTAAGMGVNSVSLTTDPASAQVKVATWSTHLAYTGVDSELQLILAALLLGIGGLLVLATRRRRRI